MKTILPFLCLIFTYLNVSKQQKGGSQNTVNSSSSRLLSELANASHRSFHPGRHGRWFALGVPPYIRDLQSRTRLLKMMSIICINFPWREKLPPPQVEMRKLSNKCLSFTIDVARWSNKCSFLLLNVIPRQLWSPELPYSQLPSILLDVKRKEGRVHMCSDQREIARVLIVLVSSSRERRGQLGAVNLC